MEFTRGIAVLGVLVNENLRKVKNVGSVTKGSIWGETLYPHLGTVNMVTIGVFCLLFLR